jgi:general secretion pathway protein K
MIRQRGVALILVLWVTALLTVLMVAFAGDARTELQLARNQLEDARAQALADAGVALAALSLLDPAPEEQWPTDGTERPVAYGGGMIRVGIQDEAGKLDLNSAPDELLGPLLRQIGLDAGDADRLAAAIVDFRNRRSAANDAAPQQQRQPRRRARRVEAQGPFTTVEELGLVPGMTRAIYDRLVPLVTIYSPTGLIDPLSAPAAVLRAIPGVDPKAVDQLIAVRDQFAANPGDLPDLPGADNYVGHTAVRAVTIRSRAHIPSGTTVTREAVITITGQPGQPYTVEAWRRPFAEPPAAEEKSP